LTNTRLNPTKTQENATRFILSCQQPDGAIPWYPAHKLDPWDHTEAAMALAVAGKLSQARTAFRWLQQNQNPDGSWYANYFPIASDKRIETNFVAYPATGVWHYFLITGDQAFVREYFPMVEACIDFVLKHQSEEGDVQWAISETEQLAKDALVTACSSILRSLECALHLTRVLDKPKPLWQAGYQRLATTLTSKPWRFDRTWESKARYSMDWFYPILSGLYSHHEARQRLQQGWQTFVEPGLGCRCVSDEPWFTVAESCELIMALQAANQQAKARKLLSGLCRWQDNDGGFWTGYNFHTQVIWPCEKTSWTAAAYLLASDAVLQLTPAARLFTTPSAFYTATDCRLRITSD